MTDTTSLDLTADIIDVRDIIARIEELEAEREALSDSVEACEEAYQFHDSGDTRSTPEWRDLLESKDQLSQWDESGEASELAALTAIMDDLKSSGGDERWRGDWYPVTLIRDHYFTDYCRELTQDIGDLPKDIPAYIAIDWDATADNLRVDYSSLEIACNDRWVTYWYR